MRNEQFKRLVVFLESIGLILGLTFMYWVVWENNYRYSIIEPFWNRGNYVVVALYAVLLFCFNKLYGGIRVGYLRTMDVLFSEILSVTIVNCITYLELCLIGRWRFLTHLQPLLIMFALQIVFVVVWVFMTKWIYFNLYPPRKILLVYGERPADDLIQKMNRREDKYDIERAINLKEGMEKIKKEILEYEGVVIYDMPAHERNLILKYCYSQSIRAYLIPKISDIIIMSTDNIHLFDTPLLLSRNSSMNAEQLFFKRMMDILVSLGMLIVTSPFMLIFAACIKLYDGSWWNIFYYQNYKYELYSS